MGSLISSSAKRTLPKTKTFVNNAAKPTVQLNKNGGSVGHDVEAKQPAPRQHLASEEKDHGSDYSWNGMVTNLKQISQLLYKTRKTRI
jgi:hypothetical protein